MNNMARPKKHTSKMLMAYARAGNA